MKKAVVDLEERKITGCKKGSFDWFHEKGHLVYSDSDTGRRNEYIQQLALYGSLIFLALANFVDLAKYLALASVIVFFLLFAYEEMWCQRYANKNYKK